MVLNYPKGTVAGKTEAKLHLKNIQGEQPYYESQILTQLVFNTMENMHAKYA